MRSFLSGLCAASLLGAATLAAAADIDVMTQNQYLGADLAPVLGAATSVPFDLDALNTAVVQALQKIAATRPAERAKALAAGIQQRNPDVVGLQEAYSFQCAPYPGAPAMPGMGCDDPRVRDAFTDHLSDTLAALGGRYVLAGKVTNMSVPALPFMVNGYPALLAMADRDAILVRKGLTASPVDFSAWPGCRVSDQGCNFWTAPPVFDTPIGPLRIERGFVAADVDVRGTAYRVFNTHLEQRLLDPTLPQTRLLQVGQSYELLGMAVGTWDGLKKVLVVGDFNSAPGDTIPMPPYPPTLPGTTLPTLTPYQVFALSGFTDAWTMRAAPGDGPSCCQSETLTNARSQLYERIDLVFSLTPPLRVVDMRLLGYTMGDKTRPGGNGGLWPSDHAAVAARLFFD